MSSSFKLDILYEDKDLLVVCKPSKLLTVSTLKEKEQTLYYMVSSYVKKKHPKNKVFIVNRLDKDTSGIVVFAKSLRVKKLYQDNWSSYARVREYLAIVSGVVKKDKDVLKNYLREDNNFRVYVSKSGLLAITSYEVLKRIRGYTLLKVRIFSGKKNQIRVQLSNISHPIVGDKKYGDKKNPINRLGLHAFLLELRIGFEYKVIKAKIPKEFKRMFNSLED